MTVSLHRMSRPSCQWKPRYGCHRAAEYELFRDGRLIGRYCGEHGPLAEAEVTFTLTLTNPFQAPPSAEADR